jgi:hypothetical protein
MFLEEKSAILASLLLRLLICSALPLPQSNLLRTHSASVEARGAFAQDKGIARDTTVKARTQEEQDRGKSRPTAQLRPEWMWPRPSGALPFVQSPTGFELTFDILDSLSRLHPELKEGLLREAIIAGALRDDSIYCAWHDNYLKAISGLRLPGELEAEMRQNQQRFGTTYNPMRGPMNPYQVDVIKLLRSLANLYEVIFGK